MSNESMKLVLASQSPRRKQLLAEAGYAFEIVTPSADAECGACSNQGPAALVGELALSKALDVRQQLSARGENGRLIIVAADTVAECDGRILGKPVDAEHAGEMLRLLSGKVHRVYTGVCVWPILANGSALQEPRVEVDKTTLEMDQLMDAAIDDYVASDAWVGKAGGFGYQDGLDWLHIVEGSESNVVGLPMERLREMLSSLGCDEPA